MVVFVSTDTDYRGVPRLSMRYGFFDHVHNRQVNVRWHSTGPQVWMRYVEWTA